MLSDLEGVIKAEVEFLNDNREVRVKSFRFGGRKLFMSKSQTWLQELPLAESGIIPKISHGAGEQELLP